MHAPEALLVLAQIRKIGVLDLISDPEVHRDGGLELCARWLAVYHPRDEEIGSAGDEVFDVVHDDRAEGLLRSATLTVDV